MRRPSEVRLVLVVTIGLSNLSLHLFPFPPKTTPVDLEFLQLLSARAQGTANLICNHILKHLPSVVTHNFSVLSRGKLHPARGRCSPVGRSVAVRQITPARMGCEYYQLPMQGESYVLPSRLIACRFLRLSCVMGTDGSCYFSGEPGSYRGPRRDEVPHLQIKEN